MYYIQSSDHNTYHWNYTTRAFYSRRFRFNNILSYYFNKELICRARKSCRSALVECSFGKQLYCLQCAYSYRVTVYYIEINFFFFPKDDSTIRYCSLIAIYLSRVQRIISKNKFSPQINRINDWKVILHLSSKRKRNNIFERDYRVHLIHFEKHIINKHITLCDLFHFGLRKHRYEIIKIIDAFENIDFIRILGVEYSKFTSRSRMRSLLFY